jgi:hypothetical protein
MSDRLEHVLARVLADGDFRRRFRADPEGVGAQEGLSAEDSAALAAMPVQDVETAARSFACKRDGKARQARPSWLKSLLGGGRP